VKRPLLYHVATLGCKLNQFDSATLEAGLVSLGMAPTCDPSLARVIVVNTCTVTSAADAQSRQLIRRLRRASPASTLLVTGCYAQRDPKALESIPGVDAVVGLAAQGRLRQWVVKLVPELPRQTACLEAAEDPLPAYSDRTRAFLKIQDGCDLRCSYCVIPSVRGGSRSIPPDQVLQRVTLLAQAGFREIVFTGVNTGDYGKDLDPPNTLATLLRQVVRIPELGRLRLNSVEPRCVTEELVDALGSSPKIAPHLQVPLQSGSDSVLARMRRPYRTAHYSLALDAVRHRIPEAGLGADIIVGFPGETEREFRQTLRFVAASELNYLHVFSYSPRPGTPAADAADRVGGEVMRERSAELRALGWELSHRFRSSFLGKELEVLGLKERLADGALRALSGNFIDVALPAAPDSLVNQLVRARVTEVSDARVSAAPC
jgi:threonylcarbamoyladenosine tRNA methylthiotransferase MtaB